MLKEQLLAFRYINKDPTATPTQLLETYNKTKTLIDTITQKTYLRNIMYEYFLKGKTWKTIAIACNRAHEDAIRKMISRLIKKYEERRIQNGYKKI